MVLLHHLGLRQLLEHFLEKLGVILALGEREIGIALDDYGL